MPNSQQQKRKCEVDAGIAEQISVPTLLLHYKLPSCEKSSFYHNHHQVFHVQQLLGVSWVKNDLTNDSRPLFPTKWSSLITGLLLAACLLKPRKLSNP